MSIVGISKNFLIIVDGIITNTRVVSKTRWRTELGHQALQASLVMTAATRNLRKYMERL